MPYRKSIMLVLPAFLALLAVAPRLTGAPLPDPQPSAAQIDAAVGYAAREAGLPQR